MVEKLVVKCSKCSLEFDYYSSEYRPFCSERCKAVDLGYWFQESYKIPSKLPLNEQDIEKLIEEKNNDDEIECAIKKTFE